MKNEKAYSLKCTKHMRSVICVISLLLVFCFALSCTSCSGKNKAVKFKGRWQYGENIVYEFDGVNKGCLISGDAHYDYSYTVVGDRLNIDFAEENVIDCDYTYSIKGNKLTLIGGEHTAEPGKAYELKKIADN